jgi:hypothetical protein
MKICCFQALQTFALHSLVMSPESPLGQLDAKTIASLERLEMPLCTAMVCLHATNGVRVYTCACILCVYKYFLLHAHTDTHNHASSEVSTCTSPPYLGDLHVYKPALPWRFARVQVRLEMDLSKQLHDRTQILDIRIGAPTVSLSHTNVVHKRLICNSVRVLPLSITYTIIHTHTHTHTGCIWNQNAHTKVIITCLHGHRNTHTRNIL